MNVIEILSKLRRLDARVRLDGDQLRLNAPQGVLEPAFVETLRQHKAEIVDFLRAARGDQSTISPMPREGDPVVSFAQERLWFLQQLDLPL